MMPTTALEQRILPFRQNLHETTLNLDGIELTKVPDVLLCRPLSERIQYLSLANNRINFLSPEIRELKNLIFLDLRNNFLNALPAEVGELSGLRHLLLGSNSFSTVPSVLCLPNLRNLEVLELSSQHFVDLPEGLLWLNLKVLLIHRIGLTKMPEVVASFINLEELDVSDNQLTAFPRMLVGLPLRVLNLSGNPIREIPKYIGRCKHLVVLNLENTELQQLPWEMGMLLELQTLNLANNQITTLPEKVRFWKKIRKLDCSGNPLCSFPLPIMQFPWIEHLALSFQKLTEVPAEMKQMLRTLNTLHLSVYGQKEVFCIEKITTERVAEAFAKILATLNPQA